MYVCMYVKMKVDIFMFVGMKISKIACTKTVCMYVCMYALLVYLTVMEDFHHCTECMHSISVRAQLS